MENNSLITHKFLFFCLFFFTYLFAANPTVKLPAFPNAQGGGAISEGGRGGKIIEVTNLNSSGTGSLREAIEENGPRIVIFKVSGIIDLQSRPLEIKNPYISILGQSAPEGGITIKGHEISIQTHDVIIQYLKVRTGRNNSFTKQVGDSIGMSNNAYNVIIDHCSLSWSNDENAQVWSYDKPSRNITWSWNILSEGLTYNHASCGLIAGSNVNPDDMTDIDIHHNLFAHFNNRMPLIKVKSSRVINNLMYDWQWHATAISGGVSADIIGNKYTPGPNTPKSRYFAIAVTTDEIRNLKFAAQDLMYGPLGKPSIYIQDNLAPGILNSKQDNWSTIREWDDFRWPTINENKYRRKSPLQSSTFPITIQNALSAEQDILKSSGASKRVNEYGQWIDARDNIDKRIIQEYQTKTGIIPVDEKQVGGYEKINPKNGYLDSDHDGISDVWEYYYGLDPENPSDAKKDSDKNGYTHFEEFIYGMKPIPKK